MRRVMDIEERVRLARNGDLQAMWEAISTVTGHRQDEDRYLRAVEDGLLSLIHAASSGVSDEMP